jgi:hypothetical protein
MVISFGFGYSHAEEPDGITNYTVTIPENMTFQGGDGSGNGGDMTVSVSAQVGDNKTLKVSLKNSGNFIRVPATDDGNRSYPETMDLDEATKRSLAMKLEPPEQSDAKPICSVVEVFNSESGIGYIDDGVNNFFYLREWSFDKNGLYPIIIINSTVNIQDQKATIRLGSPSTYTTTTEDNGKELNNLNYEKIKADDYTGSLTFVISCDSDIVSAGG